jgi:hypothetical protein
MALLALVDNCLLAFCVKSSLYAIVVYTLGVDRVEHSLLQFSNLFTLDRREP